MWLDNQMQRYGEYNKLNIITLCTAEHPQHTGVDPGGGIQYIVVLHSSTGAPLRVQNRDFRAPGVYMAFGAK